MSIHGTYHIVVWRFVCEGDWGDNDNKVTMDTAFTAEFERDTEPRCWHVNRGGSHDDQYACKLCQAHQPAAVALYRFIIESLLGRKLTDDEWAETIPEEGAPYYSELMKMHFPRMFGSTYSIGDDSCNVAYEVMLFRR